VAKSPAQVEAAVIEAAKPPVADGKTAVTSKINIAAVGTGLTGGAGVLAAFNGLFTSWPAVAGLLGLLTLLVVLIVVFRNRISYEFGA
jgi:hypothetical protein